MKINAYLENCRLSLCNAIKLTNDDKLLHIRTELIFALHELDAFRHGRLQYCDTCGEEEKQPENQ